MRANSSLAAAQLGSNLIRRNEIGIQMLSPSLHSQLFPKRTNYPTDDQITLATRHLKAHNLFGKTSGDLENVDLKLPALLGPDISSHFQILGSEQESKYLRFALDLAECDIPRMPDTWIQQEGWTRYNRDGTTEKIEFPPIGESLVFDVEVLYKISPFPVIATAVSPHAWYGWIMPGFFESKKKIVIPDTLIPMGFPETPRLVVGHFVSYDRARIKEEYLLKTSKIAFLDTLSLHSAVGGLSTQQRAKWLKYHKEKDDPTLDLDGEHPEFSDMHLDAIDFHKQEYEDTSSSSEGGKRWEDVGSINGLDRVAKLHLDKTLDKTVRKEFDSIDIKALADPVLFQEIMTYCANDVITTAELFQVLLPKFRTKCPHPVSFAGILHISKGLLTTGDNWKSYIDKSEKMCEEYRDKVERKLEALAQDALKLIDNGEYKNDRWLCNLDWTVKPLRMTKGTVSKKGVVKPSRPFASANPNMIGMPQWYRDLWDGKLKRFRLSTAKKVVPSLLRLQWKGFPLLYMAKFGWLYHGSAEETSSLRESKPLEFEDWMNPTEVYFRVPHPAGDGKNCGNPLSKSFITAFETDTLTSTYPEAKDLLTMNNICIYWISARARISSQFVVWDKDGSMTGYKGDKIGVIIPLTASMGTVTRRATDATWMTAANAKKTRIGTELKAQIVAPAGYKFVGADVDSEELWIASLLGDAQFGIHGASAIGFMTLQGTKSAGTDLHSSSGRIVGISRDVAKIFNYSRIYGAGQHYAARLLLQHSPGLDKIQAQAKADHLYNQTKGLRARDYKKLFGAETFWHGGSESFMFNQLELVASRADSRTPVLGCQIPDTLSTEYVHDSFKTSRINWVVQSSGVDYLHLLLVAMDYLMRRMKIDGRFLLSIHDEVRFLIKDEDVPRAALALQISNLWTRSLFASRVGIQDLPLNVAFFSAIDIDHVLRKEVDMDCVTPSNTTPISPGVSKDIYQVIEAISNEDGDTLYGPELESVQSILRQTKPVPVEEEQAAAPISCDFIRAQLTTSTPELKELLRGIASREARNRIPKPRTFSKIN